MEGIRQSQVLESRSVSDFLQSRAATERKIDVSVSGASVSMKEFVSPPSANTRNEL